MRDFYPWDMEDVTAEVTEACADAALCAWLPETRQRPAAATAGRSAGGRIC